MSKTAFIGHRVIFSKTLPERLMTAIISEIDNGCDSFTMGTHGRFDSLALSACKKISNIHSDIKIEVVITGLNAINTESNYINGFILDPHIKTVIYDIEETHYKRQITLSNKKMIDSCDTLICFVDEKSYRSGAKNALRYARKKGVKVVNLYCEEDSFPCMTKEEIDNYYEDLCKKYQAKK